MSKLNLLKELIRRRVDKFSDLSNMSREVRETNRAIFFQNLLDSNGEFLLKFIAIDDKAPQLKASKIIKHIQLRTNIVLNNKQKMFIMGYVKALGGVSYRSSKNVFYKNVRLL